ncbi:MAG: Rieske 2Fe-2S domain-containing protein [Caldilineaceae bacterium]|nr:Rieske 2Fe-2S domain-containing protein [Caldilineaceae bacterium]MCB0095917.1 Rieske 2Fe-2S domain-containing protein [Caldilineaceae bacterium]MCB0140259.1 Rieske 2Fe-2S domain-containing protein [Caldilineaceae bacterium]
MADKTFLESAKVGEQHAVLCVRARGLEWISEEKWLPVIGPLHADAEFLNFPVEHYHIDFRFVDHISFANVSSKYVSDGQTGQLLGLVVGKDQIVEGPAEQIMAFHRSMPVYPSHSSKGENLPYFCALEDAFAEWVIVPELAICPHRGLSLAGLADENGIAICSGHGLAWDMKTGKCVRRFSKSQANR